MSAYEDDEDLENNIITVFPGTSNRCLQPRLVQTLVSTGRRHAVFINSFWFKEVFAVVFENHLSLAQDGFYNLRSRRSHPWSEYYNEIN